MLRVLAFISSNISNIESIALAIDRFFNLTCITSHCAAANPGRSIIRGSEQVHFLQGQLSNYDGVLRAIQHIGFVLHIILPETPRIPAQL